MDMMEAMARRHTVRAFIDRPLHAEIRAQLDERIDRLNEQHNVNMKLICDNAQAFNGMLRVVLAKGVKNYIALAGPDDRTCDERIGRCSAELMLFAQTLGLNTWWVGGSFSKGKVADIVGIEPGRHLAGIVAIGFGATQGKPHVSKTAAEVSAYEGDAPAWFEAGVAAALLAPTALNKQAFAITGAGDAVHIDYDRGAFAGVDLGIVKYHFQLGAGQENFSWR